MHSGSGTGFGPGSSRKCNTKVKKNLKLEAINHYGSTTLHTTKRKAAEKRKLFKDVLF